MRILQLLHEFLPHSYAGVEVHVWRLTKALAEHGVQTLVVAGSEHQVGQGPPARHVVDGVDVVRLLRTRPDRSSPDPMGRLSESRRLIRDFEDTVTSFQPDLVHVHHVLNLPRQLWRVLVRRGIPYVFSVHDYAALCARLILLDVDGRQCQGPLGGLRCMPCLAKDGRGLSRAAFRALSWSREGQSMMRHASRLVVPSQVVSDILIDHGISADPLVRVGYGVPTISREPRDIGGRPVVFGYIGSIAPHKGVDLLVEAFCGLEPENPARLVVYGDVGRSGAFGERLHFLAANHPRISFAGSFEPGRLADVLGRLDMLVVPSLWRETGPQVVQEALAAGLPVLGSDIGGIQEQIEHGRNGFLFRQGHSGELRSWIETLACQPDRLVELSWRTDSVRTPEVVARELLDIYRAVLRQVPPWPAQPSR